MADPAPAPEPPEDDGEVEDIHLTEEEIAASDAAFARLRADPQFKSPWLPRRAPPTTSRDV